MIPRSLSRPVLACAVLAGCGGPPRVETPDVRGPLALRVVHPAAGATVESRGGAYLIGSVGNGAATLSINGQRVAVRSNGSFLAYLPLPGGDAPAYRLAASLGDETVHRVVPVRLAGGRAKLPGAGPLVVDSASVLPAAPLRLYPEERVRVSVRAPANARVWAATAGGRHALRGNTPVAATAEDARRGVPRRRDPELWAVDLSARDLAGRAALVAVRGADTVRLALPRVELADPARPRRVRLRASAAGGADREIVGRPSPEGEYRWFLLPGTRLDATGARGPLLRVRLDSGQEAWMDAELATPLDSAPGAGVPRAGAARLRPAREWVDVEIPLSAPPAYLVEQGERELSLTLYGVAGTEGAPPAGGDGYVRGVAARRELRDRARYTVQLAASPYGYQAFWRDGTFVLRVRRPPAVGRRAPLRGLVVAVDAGHPPHGAVGPTGLREPEVTLQVARRLARLLAERGARVVLTRQGDGPVALEERTAIALRSGAHALVSIHADALAGGQDPSRVNGTATYFFHPQSAALAGAVQRGMVARMGRQDRGFRQKNLAVARATWMPSVLCEGAMIIHPDEEAALRTPAFQEAYARGIADGLVDYFRALGEGT